MEKTFSESRQSFLATSDSVFTDMVSDGWFDRMDIDIDSEQANAVKNALKRFDGLREKVGDDASLKELYEAGKGAVKAAKDLAILDDKGEAQGGKAFTLAKDYQIEQGAQLETLNLKSKVTQKAAQDLSDTALEFSGEAERLNQEFTNLSVQRQVQGTVAPSSRAGIGVFVDQTADTMRQFGMHQIQTAKQLSVLAEGQALTVSQLTIQNEELFRQAQQEQEIQSARWFEQLRLEAEEVSELTSYTEGVSQVFASAVPLSAGPAADEDYEFGPHDHEHDDEHDR